MVSFHLFAFIHILSHDDDRRSGWLTASINIIFASYACKCEYIVYQPAAFFMQTYIAKKNYYMHIFFFAAYDDDDDEHQRIFNLYKVSTKNTKKN